MAYTDPAGNRIAVYSLGIAPAISIAGKSAVTTGTALDGLTVRSAAVLTVTATTGVTAGAVQLQSSLDGQAYWNVGSPISVTAAGTTAAAYSLQADIAAIGRYVRAAITTAITGGTVTVSVGLSG